MTTFSPMITLKQGLKLDFTDKFGDKRLADRATSLSRSMLKSKDSSVRQTCSTKAEQKAVYRFYNNEHVTESELVSCCTERTSMLCKDKHILVLNDTTEINLKNHTGRMQAGSGVGVVGNNKDLGFFAHLGLCIDIETHQAIGFSSMRLWHRLENKGTKTTRGYDKLPIEEKESYKWIECVKDSKAVLADAASVTVVGDRESDIYELFADAASLGIEIVARNRVDRKTKEGSYLYSNLAKAEIAGSYEIDVQGDARKETKNRKATLTIKHTKVEILKPVNKKDDRPKSVTVYIVEAQEVGTTDGICWRILTSHKITNYAEAIQIIEWYQMRWYIEEVFRLLKNKGYKIENNQFENGYALRKHCVLLLQNVLRVAQMLVAYHSTEEQDAKLAFSDDEITCLTVACKQQEGKTEKLKNSHKQGTLKWATWIIARLGGWSGYVSQRPPGPITLKNGLDNFSYIYTGWQMAKDVGTQ